MMAENAAFLLTNSWQLPLGLEATSSVVTISGIPQLGIRNPLQASTLDIDKDLINAHLNSQAQAESSDYPATGTDFPNNYFSPDIVTFSPNLKAEKKENGQDELTSKLATEPLVGIESSSFNAPTQQTESVDSLLNNYAPTATGENTAQGKLKRSDNADSSGRFYDDYLLADVTPNTTIQISLNSDRFDPFLELYNAETRELITFDDDGGGNLNSLLTFTAESGIDYLIRVTSFASQETGSYRVATSFASSNSFSTNYGYGLVDAASAVAEAIGAIEFPDVPTFGAANDWNLNMVKAPEVWAQGFTGADVVVAVLDTGVDYTHSDLDGSIWVNPGEIAGNGIDDDRNGFVDDNQGWDFADNDRDPLDEDGHGTHVAGTIAAENNGVGATGVAYDAEIMPVRVLGEEGGTDRDLAAGIYYAVNNGASVINLSLGSASPSTTIASALEYAWEQDVVVVMAAGNEASTQPSYPAQYALDWGIAVGAVAQDRQVAFFSNGAGTTELDYVVAPGVNIYSTFPQQEYAFFDGTSMATPHVAGVAALVLSANPRLTASQVEDLLIETAKPDGIIT